MKPIMLVALLAYILALSARRLISLSFRGDAGYTLYDADRPVFRDSITINKMLDLLYPSEEPPGGGERDTDLTAFPFSVTFEKDTLEAIRRLIDNDMGSGWDIGPLQASKIISAIDYMDYAEAAVDVIYPNLFQKMMNGKYAKEILETNLTAIGGPGIPQKSFLRLLRNYLNASNVCVAIKDGTATVCFPDDRRYGSAIQIGYITSVHLLPSTFRLLFDTLDGSKAAGTGDTADFEAIRPEVDMPQESVPAPEDSGSISCFFEASPAIPVSPSSHVARARWDIFVWMLWNMRIVELNADGCKLDELQMSNISKLSQLRVLSLHNCSSGPAELAYIMRLKLLEELNAGGCSLSNEIIETIGSLTKLRVLRIPNCNLRINNLTALEALDLGELDVSNNSLPCDCVSTIASFSNLRILLMSGCSLEDHDLTPLRTLGLIEHLDVSSNNILHSANHPVNFQVIHRLTSLRILNMNSCNMTTGSFEDIHMLENLEELDARSGLLGYHDAQAMLRLGNLRKLHANFFSPSTVCLASIGNLARLTYLDISNSTLSPDDIRLVLLLSRLQVLRLPASAISTDGALDLSSLTELVELDVYGDKMSAENLRTVLSHTRLKRLCIRGHCIDIDGLFDMARLAELEELFLESYSLSEEEVLGIAAHAKLMKLSLICCQLPVESLLHLRKLANLEELALASIPLIEDVLKVIFASRELRKLAMIDCNISGNDILGIVMLVHLEELDIYDNWLGQYDLMAILTLQALRKLRTYDDGINHLCNEFLVDRRYMEVK